MGEKYLTNPDFNEKLSLEYCAQTATKCNKLMQFIIMGYGEGVENFIADATLELKKINNGDIIKLRYVNQFYEVNSNNWSALDIALAKSYIIMAEKILEFIMTINVRFFSAEKIFNNAVKTAFMHPKDYFYYPLIEYILGAIKKYNISLDTIVVDNHPIIAFIYNKYCRIGGDEKVFYILWKYFGTSLFESARRCFPFPKYQEIMDSIEHHSEPSDIIYPGDTYLKFKPIELLKIEIMDMHKDDKKIIENLLKDLYNGEAKNKQLTADAEEKSKEMEKKFTELKNKNDRLKNKNNELKNSNKKLYKEVSDKCMELTDANDNYNRIYEISKALSGRNEQISEEIEELKTANKKLLNEKMKLSEEKSVLSEEKNTLSEENAKLRIENEEFLDANERLTKKLNDNTGYCQNNCLKLTNISENLPKADKTPSEENKTFSNLSKSLFEINDILSEDNKTLSNINKSLSGKNKSLSEVNDALSEENKNLQDKCQNMKDFLQHIEKLIESLYNHSFEKCKKVYMGGEDSDFTRQENFMPEEVSAIMQSIALYAFSIYFTIKKYSEFLDLENKNSNERHAKSTADTLIPINSFRRCPENYVQNLESHNIEMDATKKYLESRVKILESENQNLKIQNATIEAQIEKYDELIETVSRIPEAFQKRDQKIEQLRAKLAKANELMVSLETIFNVSI